MGNPFASSEFKKVSNPFAGRRCPPTGVFALRNDEPDLTEIRQKYSDIFQQYTGQILAGRFNAPEAFTNPGGWKDSGCKVYANWEDADLPIGPKTTKPETDPNGFAPNTPGAKLDAGKLLPHLVLKEFAHALNEVVKVGTFGARKYSKNGWLQVPEGKERYAEARDRHWFGEIIDGEIDPDSNIYHAAHRIWNDLAVLELRIREHKHVNG